MKKAMCVSAVMAVMFAMAPASWAGTVPFQVVKVNSGGTAVTFKGKIAQAEVVDVGNHYHAKLLGDRTVLILHTGHNLYKKAVLYVLKKGASHPDVMLLKPVRGSLPHIYDGLKKGA